MREAAKALATSGTNAQTWESLRVESQILISAICKAIDSVGAMIAEVSDINSNVLFEVGYAIARGKEIWLAVDDTDTEATKKWNELGLLATVGRVDYSGSSEKLVARWKSKTLPDADDASLLETLLLGGKPREADAIFAPALPMKFQAALDLERFLSRQSQIRLLGASDDFGLAPLDFYVKELYRASAAIFHLARPNRRGALEHNARASLLAGIAHGFELPVLMVVETGFVAPLDYRDMLFVYDTSAALQDHVKNWLGTLPKQAGTNKRLGRLDLDVELPLRSFGQYVAEYERDELTEYFVETSEFQAILAGSAKVFVGRKGTGKTATMSQGVIELRKDRRNLVVSIKPSAYELAGLVQLAESLESENSSDYVLLSLWSYLLYTEIAVRTVSYASEKPAGGGTNQALQDLQAELESLGVNLTDDLSTRLESAVLALSAEARRDGETIQAFISRQLRSHRLARLRDLILLTLKDFKRVAVLIDNLDKAWERGADYEVMSKFLLSLLTAIGRVEKDFGKPVSGAPPVNVTLTVFLRTDIYDAISKHAREPDKIGVLSVYWHDHELLVRVLEERYAANRSRKASKTFDMWSEVFGPDVHGMTTRDYFLWRTLPRPRDFIYFANEALKTAINRKHRIIGEDDIVFAEEQYSRFAVEALLVESEAEGFDLEEALYEFAGVDSTLTIDELNDLLQEYANKDEIRDWLVRSSFLGLEVSPGAFKHVEGETSARRQMKVAKRVADKADVPERFRVHPAFRRYLEVRDDDIHDRSIVDVTLDDDTGEASS